MAIRPVNILSLCTGIGGLDLGVELAVPGARPVCMVEREAFAVAHLVRQMQAGRLASCPVWSDAATFDGRPWRGVVDLVTAGYPCQPFSTASRGRRVAHDLWPDVLRIVREAEPRLVFLENVQREPIERSGRDLADLGYRSAAAPFDAASLGAGITRRRWFLVADADREGQSPCAVDDEVAGSPGTQDVALWSDLAAEALGSTHGLPDRVDRLRALGNGVVPLQAAVAFRVLADRAGVVT